MVSGENDKRGDRGASSSRRSRRRTLSKRERRALGGYAIPCVPVGSFAYFGGRAKPPLDKLSNLSKCAVTIRLWVLRDFHKFSSEEFTFPSAEAAWRAHFLVRERDIARLAVGGDLSTLRTGLSRFYDGEALEKKIAHWKRRDGVGIVAKLLGRTDGGRTKARELGLVMGAHPIGRYGPPGAVSTLTDIWTRVLEAKFSQNPSHRRALLGTEDRHLVELTTTRIEKTPCDFWAGRVVANRLYGGNFMGERMMSARESMGPGQE